MRRFLSWLVPLHLHALPVASSSPAATVTFGAGAFVASLARGDGPTDVSRRNSARAVPSANPFRDAKRRGLASISYRLAGDVIIPTSPCRRSRASLSRRAASTVNCTVV
jgi:hypothetical protein